MCFTVENCIPIGVVITNKELQISAEHQRRKSNTFMATYKLSSIMQQIRTIVFGLKVSRVLPSSTATVVRSSLSTNSGLKHINLACEGAGGSFDLSLGSDGRSVVFTLRMPALLLEARPASAHIARASRIQSSGASDISTSADVWFSAPSLTYEDPDKSFSPPVPPPDSSADIVGLKVCALDDSQASKFVCQSFPAL